jgi:hypothetical protein
MARTDRPTPKPTPLSPPPSNTHVILRQGAEAVAYHIPISPPSSANPISKTTICLPRYSHWTSGLHFHTSHTEYLHLTSGSIFVELNGECKIYSAIAGGEVSPRTGDLLKEGLVVEVPRYARHNWGRADERVMGRYYGFHTQITRPRDADQGVVVEEWTDPADIAKPLFFWNLNGVITAPQDVVLPLPQSVLKWALGVWWVPFQLFVIFWELDNWPVFLDLRGLLQPQLGFKIAGVIENVAEYIMTLMVLFAAKIVGWLVGVRAVEQGRTPDALWEAYRVRHG